MSAPALSSDEVQLLREENAQLRTQIAWLKKQLFGPGKSETLDRAQLILKLDELEKLATPAVRATETITYERAAGPATPRPLPAENFAHLPVKETIEIVPEAVRQDPTLYEKIGEERTFEVDVIPPQLFKREIVRPKYRHRLDRSRAPLLAPAPARPVVGGYASAGLLSWVLIAKYCDHLPLFRQEKMLARWGAKISRQTMNDWVRLSAGWLEPLYKRMQHDLLAGDYIQVDETPVRCNDPDVRDGGTTPGWLWVISKPGGDVVFDWRLSRRQDELTSLLDGYLLNQWEPLTAHQQHSGTKLDNNLVENAIRPSAIGKKNWLFIGHPDAGQRSAIIYSLVVSCQRHGKNPYAYLRDVLRRLPAMTTKDDLAPLLPANWQTPAATPLL